MIFFLTVSLAKFNPLFTHPTRFNLIAKQRLSALSEGRSRVLAWGPPLLVDVGLLFVVCARHLPAAPGTS